VLRPAGWPPRAMGEITQAKLGDSLLPLAAALH
jgi:hypothetical protein